MVDLKPVARYAYDTVVGLSGNGHRPPLQTF